MAWRDISSQFAKLYTGNYTCATVSEDHRLENSALFMGQVTLWRYCSTRTCPANATLANLSTPQDLPAEQYTGCVFIYTCHMHVITVILRNSLFLTACPLYCMEEKLPEFAEMEGNGICFHTNLWNNTPILYFPYSPYIPLLFRSSLYLRHLILPLLLHPLLASIADTPLSILPFPRDPFPSSTQPYFWLFSLLPSLKITFLTAHPQVLLTSPTSATHMPHHFHSLSLVHHLFSFTSSSFLLFISPHFFLCLPHPLLLPLPTPTHFP